jgi:CheY-like chemotaxis protein
MAFGDEELMELRTQLLEAGHEPRGDAERRHAFEAVAAPGSTASHRPQPAPGPGSSGLARERDEFLAMLGHELRNPLAPMQQAVELMQAHASGEDPPYLRKARTVLVRQVEHLSRLVDVLLDAERRPPIGAGPREPSAAVALVRRVVELHGGRVVTDVEGAGRDEQLRVWLPAAPPEELPASKSPVATAGRSRQILVVDDNEDAAEMLALVLRKRGYAVVLAFDGEEALAMAQAHRPEVVLLDIGLPGIDGYEVARRLRARATSEQLMLVAVTGYGQPADRLRSREAGFDHHLVKPVAMEKLLPLLDSPPQLTRRSDPGPGSRGTR